MTLAFTIQNALSEPLADAWMTLFLPEGLIFEDAQIEPNSFEIWQNLLTTDLGELPPGQEATVQPRRPWRRWLLNCKRWPRRC